MSSSKTSIDIMLKEFGSIIDSCRTEFSQQTVLEDRSYSNAIARSYCKVLLTCCEIYTLLISGYPEGSLALSRSIYEALVIIDTLSQGKEAQDNKMLDCFFDAAIISRLRTHQSAIEWLLKNEPQNNMALKAKADIETKLHVYQRKHAREKFTDYWWAECNTFADLAKKSRFPKSYLYTRASGNVHFNSYDIFTYTGMDGNLALVGNTNDGIELSLWNTTLFFYCICGIIHQHYPDFISEPLLNRVKQLDARASSLFLQITYQKQSETSGFLHL